MPLGTVREKETSARQKTPGIQEVIIRDMFPFTLLPWNTSNSLALSSWKSLYRFGKLVFNPWKVVFSPDWTSHVPLFLLTETVLQPLEHLVVPLLNLLWFVDVCCELGDLKLYILDYAFIARGYFLLGAGLFICQVLQHRKQLSQKITQKT